MKLYIIVAAYERPIALRLLIDSFLLQTNPNWELTIIHDGPASDEIKNTIAMYKNIEKIHYIESVERNGKWGHPNRKWILEQMPLCKDFILMTNDDNYYVPKFIEYMLNKCDQNVGMAYCNTVHSYMNYNILYTKLIQNQVDLGSYITRLDVAKEVGFNHMFEQADGRFAEECRDRCRMKRLRIVYINLPIFVHN